MSGQPVPIGYPLWIVWADADGSLQRPVLVVALRAGTGSRDEVYLIAAGVASPSRRSCS